MKRTACAVVFAAATALCLAAESDEPLAGVKQELKQLQSDSSAQKNGNVDPKLKGALPALTLPSTAPVMVEPTGSPRRQSEKDAKKRKDADKNWLVREYEKLENKDSLASEDEKLKLAGGLTEEKSEHEQLQDQLIANDPKSREAAADSKQHPRAEPLRAPDPFAPFMKDWLANSPASGPMYDALIKANGSQPSVVATPAGEPAGAVTNISSVAADFSASDSRSDRVTASPAQNPFLAGLELPNTRENSLSLPSSGPVSELAAPASILPIKGLSPAGSDTAEPARRNTVTPPPSKLSDDKKYFPQQKRF